MDCPLRRDHGGPLQGKEIFVERKIWGNQLISFIGGEESELNIPQNGDEIGKGVQQRLSTFLIIRSSWLVHPIISPTSSPLE